MTYDPIMSSGTGMEPGQTRYDPFQEVQASLKNAKRMCSEGQFDRAKQLCLTIVRRFPDYFGALHLLGIILAEQRKFNEALPYLVQATMINPKASEALTNLAAVYSKLDAPVMAARTLEYAFRSAVPSAPMMETLGEIRWQEEDYEAGADAFSKAVSLDPSLDAAWIGLGACCDHLGRHNDSASALEAVLKRHPSSIEIIYLLSQLPIVNVDLMSLLDSAQTAVAPGQIQADLAAKTALARARALDGLGRHEEAWRALLDGNRGLADFHRQRARDESQNRVVQFQAASSPPVTPVLARNDRDDAPISLLILGPSRSGKTSLERLASVMGDVKRGYENPIILNAVRRAYHTADLPAKDQIFDLPSSLDELCTKFYLEELKERAQSAKVFTNTLPGHISGALRIAAVIPNARFVFIKRDRSDLALRIFWKIYDSGNFYAYDLKTIVDYVDWYDRMIDVVASRLPTVSAVIRYEEMITDPERTLGTVSDLCGLPAPANSLPKLGDDRGCAEPYRVLMEAELAG